MPVPQVLEEIVALVACRRQATARVDVHASQADCAWPGGEWPLPPEGTAGGCRALRRRSADIVAAGPSGVNKHAKHDYVVLSAGSGSVPRRWHRRLWLLGLGCFASDAARTSLLEVLLVFTSFQDTRHDLVRFFGVFLFCRSPCCVVSSVLSPEQRRFCLFAPPLVGLIVS